ncbi:Uncharacterised protein [Mycobacteroides abscessus subsp. abscessus]|nr:Uncharacterised protein [Mycobacteroides abscessus subsp. abscessus]
MIVELMKLDDLVGQLLDRAAPFFRLNPRMGSAPFDDHLVAAASPP